MSKPKRTYTAEFKRDAIALAERGDRSVAQIERDLGRSAGCLRHWRADARRAAAAGTTTDALADQARELHRLRREVARLREERAILKKAVAIVVHPLPTGINGEPRSARRIRCGYSVPFWVSRPAGSMPGCSVRRVHERWPTTSIWQHSRPSKPPVVSGMAAAACGLPWPVPDQRSAATICGG